MCASVSDVSTDGSTHKCGDDKPVDGVRKYCILQRRANWRLGDESHVDGEQDHHDAEDHEEFVQSSTKSLEQEDRNRDGRGDHATNFDVPAKQRVKPKATTGDVADVEYYAANTDQYGQHPTKTWDNRVAEFLGAHFRDADDAPHIQLHRDVNEDRHQDRKCESCAELVGEDSGLGEEPWADGRSCHEEDGTHQSASARGGYCSLLEGWRIGFCNVARPRGSSAG
ncbi:Hypothetical protein [Corynebacterium glutamicum ATCC 13032]|uniref:Uncharacterized protein n=1 Tax=Corynebacterium glutamicum (strain ATCC 13032 / DSM 20300 / JCM 1318 / BCRC 11384 / CCUG 27702 / LMG 3730 / NBRC 12168 / NCIMB 10025 / NRRL B-2784 / 534) TaxID=196627 RepID=Q8NRP2_CORGL|nr:Hypothetical protein [Corynebacterium glutamicum ATCC 13032]